MEIVREEERKENGIVMELAEGEELKKGRE